ncbi:hypothetical protein GCK72_024961 [Caenorhabditis remanei]|uniref:NR LBD domain-containing protein n=1 Tax=Caenorhabditis remanei TaxID=31234 RepID=A0A6A5G1J0_CAERE|nr:hypothetical protein GCK72_024961 [Caenorhabditis remanei]KAF1748494.1 hypothetical protein GCK72_024961 [Caenorhabditis remanei]
MSSTSSQKCAVCGRLTSLFNYGAHSCSACGSFFQRSLTTPKYFEDCENNECCFQDFQRAIHTDFTNVLKWKLDFTKFLSSQDLKSFLKTVHFTHAILSSAWRSYPLKQEFMSFPDGLDIFPECVKDVSCISSNLLNKIRCLLINRFKELKITQEEYLLLSAIVFSNPGMT